MSADYYELAKVSMFVISSVCLRLSNCELTDVFLRCRAAKQDDALTRMREVVRWYVSGFYKTPKGVKKPYNPILGEKFRCFWHNKQTNSRTFYIAEQVSEGEHNSVR